MTISTHRARFRSCEPWNGTAISLTERASNSSPGRIDSSDWISSAEWGRPRSRPLPDDVLALAAERKEAQAQRDFATSDRLRDELAARGFTVTDTRRAGY